jgi:hypothetical protein
MSWTESHTFQLRKSEKTHSRSHESTLRRWSPVFVWEESDVFDDKMLSRTCSFLMCLSVRLQVRKSSWVRHLVDGSRTSSFIFKPSEKHTNNSWERCWLPSFIVWSISTCASPSDEIEHNQYPRKWFIIWRSLHCLGLLLESAALKLEIRH